MRLSHVLQSDAKPSDTLHVMKEERRTSSTLRQTKHIDDCQWYLYLGQLFSPDNPVSSSN